MALQCSTLHNLGCGKESSCLERHAREGDSPVDCLPYLCVDGSLFHGVELLGTAARLAGVSLQQPDMDTDPIAQK